MAKQRRPYARARVVFGVLFVLFTFLSLTVLFLSSGSEHAGPWAGGTPPPSPLSALGGVAGIASLFGSVSTVIGWVSSTILQWREERREETAAELEAQRTKLEIEKLRTELEKLKARKKGE